MLLPKSNQIRMQSRSRRVTEISVYDGEEPRQQRDKKSMISNGMNPFHV